MLGPTKASTNAVEITETLLRAPVAPDKHAARLVVDELRSIRLSNPERFDELCLSIIESTSDETTKQFWEDVRLFAKRDGDEQ